MLPRSLSPKRVSVRTETRHAPLKIELFRAGIFNGSMLTITTRMGLGRLSRQTSEKMFVKNSIHPDVLRYPHPIVKADKLKKGTIHEFAILGTAYVLYRDSEGKAVATVAGCPHRGALLAKGRVNAQGELVCAYHAWRIRSNGTAISPSKPDKVCPIPMLKTWEKHGFIWVAHSNVPDLAFPDFVDPRYQLIGGFTEPFRAPLAVVLDNFGEIEHAFQVHSFVGTSSNLLDTLTFSSETGKDETIGRSSSKYRGLPLNFHRFFGVRDGDKYHIDWVFRFKPLHGSYNNYWSDPIDATRRPISFIITTFLVPVRDKDVDLHVFVQMAIESPELRWIAPILRRCTMAMVKCEIKADAHIARFAPESSEAGRWHLTNLDKQLFVNRRMMDRIYLTSQAAKPHSSSKTKVGV
jgi:phenylpropionate dioxygenase-like ring-hydroxylating dioxygenase large terminal subunit